MNSLTDSAVQATLKGVFALALPEIILLGTACVAFLLGAFYNRRWLWFVVSLLGVVAAGVVAMTVPSPAPTSDKFVPSLSPLIADGAAGFIRGLSLAAGFVFLFVGWSEVERGQGSRGNAAEYYGCLLVAIAGTSLVGRANDLITMFLGLELLSIPTYILLYLPSQNRLGQEASVKYFLLSILSSAVLLFGFSYFYGLTGSTNLTAINHTLSVAGRESLAPMALLAAVLVIAGVSFRITAVPFHFYAPDVYEGGPTGVVAQLAFLPKIAGFAALARIFGLLSGDPNQVPFDITTQIPLLLWIIAVMTMTLGNVLALLQDNLKRMLAYSSVAHGGYMLIGIIVATSVLPKAADPTTSLAASHVGGMDGLLLYLVAYGAMTVGAFAVILALSTANEPVEAIDDLAGLGQSRPLCAAMMATFLLSLIGLPLTAGFAGKLVLFLAAFDVPTDTPMRHLYQALAVVAAVNAAIAAYYYLRVIGVMYLRLPLRPAAAKLCVPAVIAALICTAATVFLGLYPYPLQKAAEKAVPIVMPKR